MYQINLNSGAGFQRLKSLSRRWSDDLKVSVPLIVIKISEAFSMYHQVVSTDLTLHHRSFAKLHPVLINDLDTANNVLIVLNKDGVILSFYLIDDRGRLQKDNELRKVAPKNVHQEYLDYFYCIAKNVENHVHGRNA